MKKLLVIIFSALVLITLILLAIYFVPINHKNSYPPINYKGINIPYGYSQSQELGRAIYSGKLEKTNFDESLQKGILTISTPTQSKEFSFNLQNTFVGIYSKDQKEQGKTIQWTKYSTVNEYNNALKKDTMVSMEFSDPTISTFPTEEYIKAMPRTLQISILVYQ